MPIPNLSDWTDRLAATCRDYLSETIRYKPAISAFAGVSAEVRYGSETGEFDGASVIIAALELKILKADLAAEPDGNCRVQLARLAGQTFRPVNVRSDESGTDWVFGLEQV